MASEKMPPLLAILYELRRHCEQSGIFWKAMRIRQSSTRKQMLTDDWESENLKIVALCDLLRIMAIPDEEMSRVISELETLRNSHCVVEALLKDLKKS